MHFSCRAVVLVDNCVLLVHRKKLRADGSFREYYVVPGGKQELGESDDDTLIREINEEVGIVIRPVLKFFEFESSYDDSVQKFYVCDYVSGQINTGNGPEFNILKTGELFEIEKIDLEKLKLIKLVPEEIEDELKKKIIDIIKECSK